MAIQCLKRDLETFIENIISYCGGTYPFTKLPTLCNLLQDNLFPVNYANSMHFKSQQTRDVFTSRVRMCTDIFLIRKYIYIYSVWYTTNQLWYSAVPGVFGLPPNLHNYAYYEGASLYNCTFYYVDTWMNTKIEDHVSMSVRK